MNRLGKEIFNAPKHSDRIEKLRTYADNRGMDRSKKTTEINGDGYTNSRLRLYIAIINYCNI